METESIILKAEENSGNQTSHWAEIVVDKMFMFHP